MNKLQELKIIRDVSYRLNVELINGLSLKSEDHLQTALCAYLEDKELLYFSVPNGGNKTPALRALFQLTGLVKGVPDMVIPIANKNYHGLFLELKHGKNKMSLEQRQWFKELNTNGYHCEEVRTLDQAIQIISSYLQS